MIFFLLLKLQNADFCYVIITELNFSLRDGLMSTQTQIEIGPLGSFFVVSLCRGLHILVHTHVPY